MKPLYISPASYDFTVTLGPCLKVTVKCTVCGSVPHNVHMECSLDWSVMAVTFSLFHIQWKHLCPLPAKVASSSCIQVTLSLTFLPSPPLITSDGQFPLKRGQIYCATECAEGFLGRWARTAEMERRKEDNRGKPGSFNSVGTTEHFFQEHELCKVGSFLDRAHSKLIRFAMWSVPEPTMQQQMSFHEKTLAECACQPLGDTYSASCISALSSFLLSKIYKPRGKNTDQSPVLFSSRQKYGNAFHRGYRRQETSQKVSYRFIFVCYAYTSTQHGP